MYARVDDDMVEYLGLVRRFPLVSIRDDAHLDLAIAELHRLLDLPARTAAEEAYMGALGDIIEAYETAHVHIREASGLQVIKHLMEANDLRQRDLLDVFGNRSVASAVIHGSRPIGLVHARRLSARFKLPLDVFLAGE